MEGYRTGAHTVYNIEYHFVWVTKYRYHVLKGEIAHRVIVLIRQNCESRGIKILRGHVSKEHVHILVSCPPNLSPSKIMQSLKGRSSRRLQDEYPALKKRYWGNHLWARGYFCTTVGSASEEQIRKYIDGHRKDSSEYFGTDE